MKRKKNNLIQEQLLQEHRCKHIKYHRLEKRFVITLVSFNFSMFYEISNLYNTNWLRIRISIFWYHRLLKKLKEMNEYYIIKISKAEIIAINVNGN